MQADNNNINGQQRQACAACKHQRKKCGDDCSLAPFFPCEKENSFKEARKLFGVSNLQKMISRLTAENVDKEQQKTAMESIIWEAECWGKDPIRGCYGEYSKLKDEFMALQRQVSLCRSCNGTLKLQQQQQQQQQQMMLRMNGWSNNNSQQYQTQSHLLSPFNNNNGTTGNIMRSINISNGNGSNHNVIPYGNGHGVMVGNEVGVGIGISSGNTNGNGNGNFMSPAIPFTSCVQGRLMEKGGDVQGVIRDPRSAHLTAAAISRSFYCDQEGQPKDERDGSVTAETLWDGDVGLP